MVLKLKEHGANPLLTSKGCLVKMVRTDRMAKMANLGVMAKMGLMGNLHV